MPLGFIRSCGAAAPLLALLCAALAADARADVRRCEDAAGNVTYSNQPCPNGTQKERSIEQHPAVETGAGDKRPVALDERPQRAADAGASAASREEQRQRSAQCATLAQRIEAGRQQQLAATGAERASADLGLRRLREEYQSDCEGRH